MSQKKDRSFVKGKSYNSLTIIDGSNIENRKQKVLVRCICGVEKIVCLNNILTGSIKSCGCKKSELISKSKITHGLRSSRGIYNIYHRITSRCNNIKCKDYYRYGGRGIKCLREKFEDFYRDMNDSYVEGLSIERIDNNGNYCKENCRRASMKEQSNNRRSNSIVEYMGEKMTLSQASEKSGVGRNVIMMRLKSGMTNEQAFYKGRYKTGGDMLHYERCVKI